MRGRRDFLRLGLTGLFITGTCPQILFSRLNQGLETKIPSEKQQLLEVLMSDEFPFPYDDKYFACAERIYNIRPAVGGSEWRANLNLILNPGKSLDLKVLISDTLEGLAQSKRVVELSGVSDVVDLALEGNETSRVYYQVLYREGKESWKSLSPKSFKLPFINLEKEGTIKLNFIGDDHTFDDADSELPESIKAKNLSGDYMVEFMRSLKNNPKWTPSNPLSALKNGFYLALALWHMMVNEDPDMIFLMGDTTGIGANHRWKDFGLPTTNLKDSDHNWIARNFWLRMRKLYSLLSPYVPIFIALGNHDGEAQWSATAGWSAYWRQRYFALPTSSTYPEGGHPEGKYYAFSWAGDKNNRGGALFVVLNSTAFSGSAFPAKLEQWTLGQEQRLWLEKTLEQAEKDWIFLCSHNVLGGWPAGPDGTPQNIAYGRGPLFTEEDYKAYGDPEKVEQVWINRKSKENGVRAFIYGHDHVFFSKKIGAGLNDLEMRGFCVGSTKYVGEIAWWASSFWRTHYGSYSRVPPDFWGPSGITRATIKAKETKFEYVMTGWTAHSNLPLNASRGTILSSVLLSSPAPRLACEPNSLSFRCVEDEANAVEKTLQVRNVGSGRLQFNLKASVPWLKIYPLEGEIWAKAKTINVGINNSLVEEGYYQGLISIESPQAGPSPGQIKVDLIVDPLPVYPPSKLFGQMRFQNIFGRTEAMAVLSWQDNPLNKKIIKYRIYIKDQINQWVCLAELHQNKRSFIIGKISSPDPLTFGVSAVNYKNRESEKAIVVVR